MIHRSDNAAVKLTLEKPLEGSCIYLGTSRRNPLYWFDIRVRPRGSNKHGISLYGTSRISDVALYLGDEKVVSLPLDDQIGRTYALRPLEEQILRDIDARFPTVQLRVVA